MQLRTTIVKKLIFTLITMGILYSCNNDDDSNSDTELIGNWKLIELLNDIGNGMGAFYSVESNKIITFESGGIITSNGNLFSNGTNLGNPTSGTYSNSESTFKSSDCNNPDCIITFEQNGNILIIDYACTEPCKSKYKKE